MKPTSQTKPTTSHKPPNPKPYLNLLTKLSKRKQLLILIAFTVGFASIGVYLLMQSRASTTVQNGLLYTQEELSVWRQRAQSGPYKSAGDVSSNSPGDWTRISGNANTFKGNPSIGRWTGPSGTGCVPLNGEAPSTNTQEYLRDAAFYSLVNNDSTIRQQARQELLAQARESGVDFSNTSRWCAGIYDRSPNFDIAYWLIKHFFAYDYIGAENFTAAENQLIRSWFWHGAKWLQVDLDKKLDDNFVDRYNGNYTLTKMRADNPGLGRVGFYGSQQTGAVARYYNNRRATQMYFVALVGVQQDDSNFKASAKRFHKEWLAYSVYPDGWSGEFERWRSDLPDLGWAYSTYNVAFQAMTADLFARQGDMELYNYTTSAGVHGTEGGSKNLLFAMRSLGQHLDGTYKRYGTDQAANNGNASYLIDGNHSASNWYSVHDVATIIGNLHFRDNYLRSVYMRTAPGLSGYPSKVASQGPFNAWTGTWGVYPGVLFMYGQMEDKVSPYDSTTPTPPTPSPTPPPPPEPSPPPPAPSGAYPDQVIASNPAGYYRFSETSGTTISDSSGNNRTGTATSVNLNVSGPGNLGSAATFNGSDSLVTIPHATQLAPTNALSVSFWVKPQPHTGTVGVIKSAGGNGWNQGWRLELNAAATNLTFRVNLNQDSNRTSLSMPVTPNEWSFVTATYDGNSVRLYHNGQLQNNISTTGSIYYSGTADMHLGRSDGAAYLNGSLDEPAIYTTALTATQIKAHYDAATSTTTEPEPEPTKPGDINGDNKVDISDLSILLTNWNSTTFPSADLNQDGIVNISDLSILLSNWGK